MSSTLSHNLGAIVTGDPARPLAAADAVCLEHGLIREVGTSRTCASTFIDARGLTLTPGLFERTHSPDLRRL